MNKKDEITEKVKELVIMKIETQMPSHLKLSIGSNIASLSKDEMIEHVKKGDEIGRKIINAHMSFLRAVANGEFVTAMVSAENE